MVVLLVLLEPGLPWRHLAVGHNTVHSMLPMLHSGLPLPYLGKREKIHDTIKRFTWEGGEERLINRRGK